MLGWAWAVAWGQEGWKQAPDDVRRVIFDAVLPEWSPLPGGRALEAVPVLYPPLAELAQPMLPLAGIRVDPRRHSFHRDRQVTDVVLVDAKARRTPVPLPAGRTVRTWAADAAGEHLVLQLRADDGLELHAWTGKELRVVEGVAPNPLLGATWAWLPDQTHLVVKAVTSAAPALPPEPAVPEGPEIRSARGAKASSTYEARDLLVDAWDDAAFTHFATSQLVVVDVTTQRSTPIGAPGTYGHVAPSPDGRFLLVERLRAPWSHRVVWSQFARDWEVWTIAGEKVRTVATLPAAEEIPIHGVATGPRDLAWQQSADATLIWVEAQDGGDWKVEVPHRDLVRSLAAPFDGRPVDEALAVHRVEGLWYGADGLLVLEEYERARRWRHVVTVDLDEGPETRPWFDLDRNDRYADPGDLVTRASSDGRWLLVQDGADLFFSGAGGSPDGDRPFLDRRSTAEPTARRMWRSAPDAYERFRGFVDDDPSRLWITSESPQRPPNLFVAGGAKAAKKPAVGEATLAWKLDQVTGVRDPAPELRAIHKEIVTYTRADGVPLSFTLYTPPGWKQGDAPLPTVVYAYPREFTDAKTAGQVSGSEQTFLRLYGPTHLTFALHGYAVLDATTMPVLGDPDTAYDTFVQQLVSSAQAAIDEAVKRGVTDRDRVGVTGHSHGGLMTATLLAHSDLFRAGIARSGAYNHTIRPFGFQSERRTLWEAESTYLAMSPVMFAPQLREPLLLIHGARDENPGTIPFQSERLFEAIRGSGGSARWVSLPYEGHGYAARESVEHVLAEQLEWFDRYVRDMSAP
jgi:dipeptidyl aminopeptidase/acylaminoacyl peptidase